MTIGHNLVGSGPKKVIVLHGWVSDHSAFEPVFPCRGCAECNSTIDRTISPAAAAQRRPACHRMRGPASRCNT